MKRGLALGITTFLLTGCVAHMMETQGDAIQVLGKKADRGGVIRYLNTGMDAWRKARRKDAEKQMTQFCKDDFLIVAEGPRSQFGADMPIGKSASLEMDEYWYIRFTCANTN